MGAFEWDSRKARANRRKHGVPFGDAVAALEDEEGLTVRDDLTAIDEQRFLTLGRDTLGRLLVVAYTWRGGRIRLVSACPATGGERRQYRGRSR